MSKHVRAAGLTFSRLAVGLALVALSFPARGTADSAESPETTSRVRIELELPPEVSKVPAGTSLFFQAGERELEVLLEAGSADVDLEGAGSWRLRLESPGLWHPEIAVVTDAGREPRVVELAPLPTVTVTGTFDFEEPPRQEDLAFRAQFSFPEPGETARWQHHIDCEVGPERTFACPLPRAAMDLRLQGSGWVPHYRWGFDPRTLETPSLGTLKMRRGGSVLGRIETVAAVPDLTKAVVTIAPARLSGGGDAAARRVEATFRETRPNARGYFQLDGLPPGRYALEARLGDLAPAQISALDVPPGAEIRLTEPLLLDVPLTLTFRLSPARDWLDAPWRVRVSKSSNGSSRFDAAPVYEGMVPEGGVLELPGQSVGRYSVHVFDSEGASFLSRPDLRVTSEADALVDLQLDFVAVEGRVTLDGEPLAARVLFAGYRAEQQVMSSDAEGEFLGVLPRAGAWEVEVVAEEPPVHAGLRITIPEEGESPRRVQLEIPDTLAYGQVVDADGRPVAKAGITMGSHSNSVSVRSDSKGEFEIRGMPEGPHSLTAHARLPDGRTQESRSMTAQLVEGQPIGPIRLQLLDMTPITGTVLGDTAPIAGAQVHIHPGRPGFGAVAETELDGTFRTELSEEFEMVRVVVMAPGHALKAFAVDLRQGRAIALRVPAQGGTLHLEDPYDPATFHATDLSSFLTQDGLTLAGHQLFHWSRSHGGDYGFGTTSTIPNLAPGHYRLCVGRGPVEDPSATTGLSCAEGLLTAGGLLELAPSPLDESGPDDAR